MAGSGVMRLRLARRSPRSLPIESMPTRPGRYTGAPNISDIVHPHPVYKKPDTFKKYDDVEFTKPKAIDRFTGVPGKVTKHAVKSGSAPGK